MNFTMRQKVKDAIEGKPAPYECVLLAKNIDYTRRLEQALKDKKVNEFIEFVRSQLNIYRQECLKDLSPADKVFNQNAITYSIHWRDISQFMME